jgi:hypothetical protein
LIRGKSQFAIAQVGARKPNFTSYGMGWGVTTYGGKKGLFHAGGIDGMRALVGLLPDEKLGVVVLTNSDYGNGKLAEALLFNVMDRYLQNPSTDWSSKLLALQRKDDKKQEEALQAMIAARVPNTKASLPLSDYAGTYHHDLYGDWSVAAQGDKLVFSGGGPASQGTGTHWHYDTFRLHYSDPMYADSDDLVSFVLNEEGKVDRLVSSEAGEFKRTSLPVAPSL